MSPVETQMTNDLTSLIVHVKGFVQGVGFRDFFAMAAEHHKLDRWSLAPPRRWKPLSPAR